VFICRWCAVCGSGVVGLGFWVALGCVGVSCETRRPRRRESEFHGRIPGPATGNRVGNVDLVPIISLGPALHPSGFIIKVIRGVVVVSSSQAKVGKIECVGSLKASREDTVTVPVSMEDDETARPSGLLSVADRGSASEKPAGRTRSDH
jgi:hypothetical protein